MKAQDPLTITISDSFPLASGGTFEVRNRGLFMLGVSTGGRISELLGLQIADVWQNDRAVH